MENAVYNNAYGILGLLPNSTQKEISKRLKDIEKILGIKRVPIYNYDFTHYKRLRTIQNLKNSFQNISNPKTALLHYFFRIYVNSESEADFIKKADKCFDYANIIKYYNHTDIKTFNIKKNTAILLSLLLLTDKTGINIENIADFSISLWSDILENSKYFNDFKNIYLLDDEIGIDESLFSNFNEAVLCELTNIFSHIAKRHKNNNVLSEFINVFQLSDKTYSIPQVENIYTKIDKSIQILNEMEISEDGVFDNNERLLLKKCLKSFQDEFNKLIELGLYDSEKTIIIRDSAANAIRGQILDLHNNLKEYETALKMMKFAVYISGTNGLKEKLESEIIIISNSLTDEIFMESVDKIINFIEQKLAYLSSNELENSLSELKKITRGYLSQINLSKSRYSDLFDSISYKLRSLAVNMHNNHKKLKESLMLMNTALYLAQSSDLKKQCNDDILNINNSIETKDENRFGCIAQILVYGIIWLIISFLGR